MKTDTKVPDPTLYLYKNTCMDKCSTELQKLDERVRIRPTGKASGLEGGPKSERLFTAIESPILKQRSEVCLP